VNDQTFMAESSISDIRMDRPDPAVRALRALVAASPALDPGIETVVCIPCFRRPEYLRRTLQSLAVQRTGRRFAVVMVENDASRSESVPVAAECLGVGEIRRPLRDRAAAGELLCDQCRLRDGAADVPADHQLPDDRR
jgi:hypothetical protein